MPWGSIPPLHRFVNDQKLRFAELLDRRFQSQAREEENIKDTLERNTVWAPFAIAVSIIFLIFGYILQERDMILWGSVASLLFFALSFWSLLRTVKNKLYRAAWVVLPLILIGSAERYVFAKLVHNQTMKVIQEVEKSEREADALLPIFPFHPFNPILSLPSFIPTKHPIPQANDPSYLSDLINEAMALRTYCKVLWVESDPRDIGEEVAAPKLKEALETWRSKYYERARALRETYANLPGAVIINPVFDEVVKSPFSVKKSIDFYQAYIAIDSMREQLETQFKMPRPMVFINDSPETELNNGDIHGGSLNVNKSPKTKLNNFKVRPH
jgi:hypothetical protein